MADHPNTRVCKICKQSLPIAEFKYKKSGGKGKAYPLRTCASCYRQHDATSHKVKYRRTRELSG
jgi:hypothetical protein